MMNLLHCERKYHETEIKLKPGKDHSSFRRKFKSIMATHSTMNEKLTALQKN